MDDAVKRVYKCFLASCDYLCMIDGQKACWYIDREDNQYTYVYEAGYLADDFLIKYGVF